MEVLWRVLVFHETAFLFRGIFRTNPALHN
jgi:hypothetical protein